MHRQPRGKLVKAEAVDSSLCRRCHSDRSSEKGEEENHPLRPGIVDCLSCHRMHNAAVLGQSPALLAFPPSTLDQTCSKCHSPVLPSEDEWNHPVGSPIESTDDPRLSKLRRYGGLFGPDKRVQCLSCHRAHNAVKGTANLLVGRQALCLYCHSEQNSLAPRTARFGTHPIAVRPEKATIAESYLEAGGSTGGNGEIICTTCHRAHHGVRGTAGLTLPLSEFTCTPCHTDKAEAEQSGHGGDSTALPVGEGAAANGQCRNCHGDHGWAIPFEEVNIGGSAIEKLCWYCHGPEGSSPMSAYFGHVIGLPPTAGTGGRDLPLFWQDGRRLERGATTCATCHDVHRNPVEYFLRLEPGENRSALCLGCHKRKDAVVGTKHDLALNFPGEKNRRGEAASRTGPCGACHIVHSSGPDDSWARWVGSGDREAGRLAEFCTDCHREGSFAQGKVVPEMSHPSMEVLTERPETKLVDCDGCHDPHVWNPTDSSSKGDFFVPGNGSDSFLLTPSGGQSLLCRRCHADQAEIAGTRHDFSLPGKESQEEPGPARGKGMCESCHLPHGGEPLLMWPQPLTEVDAYGTDTCLSCHDEGKMAADSRLTGFNHPVGVSPGSDTGDELPLYLSSGRKYFRGKVSCGTCHDPHRWSPPDLADRDKSSPPGPAASFLRVPADGYSPLCFPCHSNRSMVVGTDHDLRITDPTSTNLSGLVTEESGVCGSCHQVHGSASRFALWNRETGAGEEPQSRYCRGCHDDEREENAKVPARSEVHFVSYPGKGMVSRPFTRRQQSLMVMSATFSLYNREGAQESRGYISCATCHDVHRWEPDTSRSGTGRPLEGDIKNSFLKIRNTFAIARSFCKECHGDQSLEMYQRYHFPEETSSTR
jgi:predicted CXXCH cytochrome family protein